MGLEWLGYRVSPSKEGLMENNQTQVFPQASDLTSQTSVILEMYWLLLLSCQPPKGFQVDNS